MPYQDSDPERRNLMISSLAFILFFWGGGELKDNSLKLPMFNVEFCRPEIVAFFAWVALLWFLYRYWLKHSFEFWELFSIELNEKRFIDKATKISTESLGGTIVPDSMEGFHIDRLYWKRDGMYADCKYARKVSRDAKTNQIGSLTAHDPNRDTKLKFTGFSGWKKAFTITVSCMISKQSFSSYFVPYFLCLVAIVSGIVSTMF